MKTQSVLKTKLILTTLILSLAACSEKSQVVNTISGKTGVIGGVAVESSETLAKSTVSLQVMTVDADHKPISGFGCTGTLIAENLIITAAHCVPDAVDPNTHFLVGFNKDLEALTGTDVRVVKKFVRHKGYKSKNEQNNMYDIALISFIGSIPEGFQPAELLTDDLLMKENDPVTVSGYGLIKREGDNVEPSSILRKGPAIFLGFGNDNEVLLDQSQGLSGGGACSGDSGGPATIVLEDVEYVWGVASRVGNMLDQEKPCNGVSIYTSIASHKVFVDETKEILLKDLQDDKPVEAPAEELPGLAAR